MQPEAVGEKEPGVWGESNTLTIAGNPQAEP